ncbi:hypothetical protein [Flagellimonas eckloniae]|uniref:DUF4258 domain-containing protein n=1 Tax=Flagellimonas eckloniae TaxID=346185 RepID=A0A0Q1H6C3_9FLAO|nr:hypothetical protein [Allomuricauda eckloniae]KQC29177.1 hypothetical protein AAY42_04135 [Allomuricauda eckloniae]
MAFLKRLGWYMVGLSIGIVFLVFFLKKKSKETGAEFCYFPNCRVLKDMRSKPLVFSENFNQEKDTVLIQSFLTDGDIDFGKSDTKSELCKTYYISKSIEGKEWHLKTKSCSDKIVAESLSATN